MKEYVKDKTNIVILGGGTAGWITASILSKGLHKDKFSISLIESPDIPSVGVGEATIPPITLLLKFLEIDETQFLQSVNGTYKYGIHFQDWSEIGASYMHAFGKIGTSYGTYSFSDMWIKYAKILNLKGLNNFSPSAVAAYQNKFTPPIPLTQNSKPEHFYPLSQLFYAYQFDAGKMAAYLSKYATSLGVHHIKGTVNRVNNNKNGDIASLSLTDKSKVSADYFVDCSGIKGHLNKHHFGCKFRSWANELPCDSAIAVQTQRNSPAPPYTTSTAMKAGWRWQIPLRNRTGNGYVFSSQFISDEEALDELKDSLNGETFVTEPKLLRYDTGCLETPWYRNSIAIGLSSGFMEPLESTSIHLIHKYASEFKDALLLGEDMQQEAINFNKKFTAEALTIKDFLLAHYSITKRNDSKFWKHCQTMPITNTLKKYLSEFNQTGNITLPKNNLFPFESWLQMLTGQGFLPTNTGFETPQLDHQHALQFFSNVEMAINTEVKKLSSHQAFIS